MKLISCLESIRLFSLLVWLYVIAYQFVYPIGVSEGHPFSVFIPIRVDIVGMSAFAISFIADLIIRNYEM